MLDHRRGSAVAALLFVLLALTPAARGEEALRRAERDCQADLFCVEGLAFTGHAEIWLESFSHQVLTLALAVRTGGDAEPPHRIRHLLERPERLKLLDIPLPSGHDWQVAWDYTYHPGRTPARHDNSATYRLPYASGTTHEVIQGYGGFTHKGPGRFAVDWAMPPGTPVLAARDGVVIGLWDRSAKGGPDPSFRGNENFLWIRQADGTVAHYLHLQKDGVLVALGEEVAAGQVVARSGATGYATQPHLHFHVSSVALGDDAFITFPLRFRTSGGIVIRPEVGRAYMAP